MLGDRDASCVSVSHYECWILGYVMYRYAHLFCYCIAILTTGMCIVLVSGIAKTVVAVTSFGICFDSIVVVIYVY